MTSRIEDLDEIIEVIKAKNLDFSENEKLKKSSLYSLLRPSQWLMLIYSLILHSATANNRIPESVKHGLSEFSPSNFYCNNYQNEQPKFYQLILNSAQKYWLPLQRAHKQRLAFLAILLGIKCLKPSFTKADIISESFFINNQAIEVELLSNINGTQIEITNKLIKKYLLSRVAGSNVNIIIMLFPLFVNETNGFNKMLNVANKIMNEKDYFKRANNNSVLWGDLLGSDRHYINLIYGVEIGKIIK